MKALLLLRGMPHHGGDELAEASDPIRLAKTMAYALWPSRVARTGYRTAVAARSAAPFTAGQEDLGAPR